MIDYTRLDNKLNLLSYLSTLKPIQLISTINDKLIGEDKYGHGNGDGYGSGYGSGSSDGSGDGEGSGDGYG